MNAVPSRAPTITLFGCGISIRGGGPLCVIKGHQHLCLRHRMEWRSRPRFFRRHRKGGICVWDLSEFAADAQAVETPAWEGLLPLSDQVQYTNAKVLLVGESARVGKTGLTERLVHNRRPQRGPSTAGTWSTQWSLKDLPQKPGWEREVWLWDFGGQADQRLIHQLYLDRTALVLLMFNADRDSVLPGLREWQQALARSTALGPDGRFWSPAAPMSASVSTAKRFGASQKENDYEYFETSAETGSGIPELRKAMLEKIPWDQLYAAQLPGSFQKVEG